MTSVQQTFVKIYKYMKKVIDANKTNDTDEEDKFKSNKPWSSESCTEDEFSVESQVLHRCGVEDRNGPKEAHGVAGVCVAGRRVDHVK